MAVLPKVTCQFSIIHIKNCNDILRRNIKTYLGINIIQIWNYPKKQEKLCWYHNTWIQTYYRAKGITTATLYWNKTRDILEKEIWKAALLQPSYCWWTCQRILANDSIFEKNCCKKWALIGGRVKDDPCISSCAKFIFKWVKLLIFLKSENLKLLEGRKFSKIPE